MTTIELLSPEAHGHLRLRAPDAQTPHFVQILSAEFTTAAACCPILLTKEAATGAFYAGAMFGFKPGENLLGEAKDRGGFEPLILRRGGFFMSGENIAIDRAHARFSDHEGEPLFDELRQPGKSLRAIQRTLGEIHAGLELTREFIKTLSLLRLIEPIDISIGAGPARLSLQGLYTVSLDRLRDLDDAEVLRLFRAGYLQLVYVMATSLKHIGRLAALRPQGP